MFIEYILQNGALPKPLVHSTDLFMDWWMSGSPFKNGYFKEQITFVDLFTIKR